MSANVKFSVIVPAYGVANYISDALGCLMHQNYDNFEVIVVNDASPDRTAAIAQQFVERDDRFILINHEVNKGVSAARNTGIAAATGDYLLFLDPDDTYETFLLQVCARVLEQNPVDLLVYGFTEDYRDEKGNLEYSKTFSLKDLEYDDERFSTNDEVTIHRLAMGMEHTTMLGYPWNKCFKTSVVRAHGLQFPAIKHVEDILFNCDYMDHVKSMTILADVLYHYRNQGQSRLTGGYIKDYFELQKTRIKRIYDQQQSWKTCDFEALEYLSSIYFRSMQSMMVRELTAGTEDEKILAICKAEVGTELYEELRKHLPRYNNKLRKLYEPMAQELFGTALRRAKTIKFTREHFPGLFNKAKQSR